MPPMSLLVVAQLGEHAAGAYGAGLYAGSPPAQHSIPQLIVKDGAVFANSRDVAKHFEKEHMLVLEDIRNIVGGLTAEFSALWFQPTNREQKVGFGVRTFPTYNMTRDGFSLLAMGFTGHKALKLSTSKRYT